MSDPSAAIPDLFDPEDFKISEQPPPILYEYMVADRIDGVLEQGMVRFTHLLDTNDSFEVRKTFRRFAGPKLIKIMPRAIRAMVTPEYMEKELRSNLAERGIQVPTSQVKEMFRQQFGLSLDNCMRSQMSEFVDKFSRWY